MELDIFKSKVTELHEKSGMDDYLDWPLVYDADERGKILVDENGKFHFADQVSNWIPSHLTLEDLANLRFTKTYDDPRIDMECAEPTESCIILNFYSGESIELVNFHGIFDMLTIIRLAENEFAMENLEMLQAMCTCKELDFRIGHA